MCRWLAKNTRAMSSRCEVDLSPWRRRCSLKTSKRSGVDLWAGRVTRASASCRTLRCGRLRIRVRGGCGALQQPAGRGREIDIVELAAGQFLDEDVDLRARRQAAV